MMVGTSVTTGQQNTVVWGGIHQKTSPHGGTSNHGCVVAHSRAHVHRTHKRTRTCTHSIDSGGVSLTAALERET